MPLLKNFDLSAPAEGVRQPNLISQARCISALYEANFQKMKNKSFWKIVVHCVTEVKRHDPANCIGVCTVEIETDKDFFYKQNNQKKKELALEWLWMGIKKAVGFYEWDIAPFQSAYDAVVAKNYVNHWTYGKPKKNPSRTFVARVECDHDIEGFTANLFIADRAGMDVFVQQIFQTRPREFSFVQNLGQLSWKTDDEVTFNAQNGHALIIAKKIGEVWSIKEAEKGNEPTRQP